MITEQSNTLQKKAHHFDTLDAERYNEVCQSVCLYVVCLFVCSMSVSM